MIYRSWFLQIFCLSNNCNHHTTTQFEKSQFGTTIDGKRQTAKVERPSFCCLFYTELKIFASTGNDSVFLKNFQICVNFLPFPVAKNVRNTLLN